MKLKRITSLFLLVTAICSFSQVKAETIKNGEQRTNRIYLRSSHTQFEVYIDDVLMFKLFGELTKNGAGVTGDYDINQLILNSGEHEVKVRMYPKYGLVVFDKMGGYLDLTFSYFRDNDLSTVQYNEEMNGINSIELSDSDKQWFSEYDPETGATFGGMFKPKPPIKFEGLPMYEWEKTFYAEVPFNFLGWKKSINLKELNKKKQKEVEEELLKSYEKIYQTIKNKNITDYLSLVKEREELITSTLYYTDQEKQFRQNELIALIKNNDYELIPIDKENIKIEYQGYGKLITFLDRSDGESIIRLKNKKDPNDIVFLDFKFHKRAENLPLSIIQ